MTPLVPHSPAWYDRLATLQEGYFYPWRSHLGAGNGEDAYLALVRQHLRPDADVLDAACGHGDVALDVAARCRSVLGYDRVARWIELAQRTARERGVANVTFVCYDSSPEANGGQARLPAPDRSFDLLLCRRGPFHWVTDARRVARPGAVLLMLIPDATPDEPWRAWLPEALRWYVDEGGIPDWARLAIARRLAPSGLAVDSWWSFDVPERFPDPEQLYTWLVWGRAPGEVPGFAAVRPVLERVFAACGDRDGVAIRHRRFLWRAIVPESPDVQAAPR